VQDVATRYNDPQPYTGIGTEMNLSYVEGFIAHLFERNRIRGHDVRPNNPWQAEEEFSEQEPYRIWIFSF